MVVVIADDVDVVGVVYGGKVIIQQTKKKNRELNEMKCKKLN